MTTNTYQALAAMVLFIEPPVIMTPFPVAAPIGIRLLEIDHDLRMSAVP